jgi:uncharacterized tellurite resistance protein B-like protein
MDKQVFEALLLKSIFACMACDQQIDAKEMAHIRQQAKEKGLFGGLDLEMELKRLESELNEQGYGFFRSFFAELSGAGLDREQELRLLDASVDMVEANEEIEYAEVKFVKLIRAELKVSDVEILVANPAHNDYLKQDVFPINPKKQLMSEFFVQEKFPTIQIPVQD